MITRWAARPALAALLLALPILAGAAPAVECRELTQTGADPALACESRAWLTQPDDDRLGNQAGLVQTLGQGQPSWPGWGPTEPSVSAADDGGALYVTHSSGAAPGVTSARFEGAVTGNLDSVALDLYMVSSEEYDEYLPGSFADARSCAAAVGCDGVFPVFLALELDGHRHEVGEVRAYLYPPFTSGNVVAMRVRLVVTGLFDGVDDAAAGHDLAVEVWPHDGEMTVLYDAVEWPSKLLFNQQDMTSYSVVELGEQHDHS
ncbi:MAG: hypothetical protein ACJA2H_000445 [Nitriliruptoraceae bacterium]